MITNKFCFGCFCIYLLGFNAINFEF